MVKVTDYVRAFAVALALAALGAVARADGPPPANDPVDACLEEGERKLDRLRTEPTLEKRLAVAAEIRRLCESAFKQKPADVRSVILMAKSQLVGGPDHPDECRPGACEEALRLLGVARKFDRDRQEAPRIAFELAMVFSRMGRFADAISEYDNAMHYVEIERRWNSWQENFDEVLLWGNSAESLMALGRLPESIDRYRRAVEVADRGSLGWLLGMWGLGVALDRDDQVELARKTIRQVLELDPAMGRLHADSVFFEPPGDIWYYTALGHEVAGDLARAVEDYRRFLREVPTSQFAGRARTHLALLAKDKGAQEPIVHGTLKLLSVEGEPDRWVATVRRQFERHRAELDTCYERALREVPMTQGWVRMEFKYGDQGADFDFAPRPGPFTEAFARCAAFTMLGWRFEWSGPGQPKAVVVLELGGRQ